MRKAFTMIELIFVIVIIGILASVAIPKMMAIQMESRKALITQYVSTLNKTVGAVMYSETIPTGNQIGHILNKNFCNKLSLTSNKYMNMIDEVTVEDDCTLTINIDATFTSGEFIDGNITTQPRWTYKF